MAQQQLSLYSRASVLTTKLLLVAFQSLTCTLVHFIHFTTLEKSLVASDCSQGKVPNSYYSLYV